MSHASKRAGKSLEWKPLGLLLVYGRVRFGIKADRLQPAL